MVQETLGTQSTWGKAVPSTGYGLLQSNCPNFTRLTCVRKHGT